MTHNLTRRRYPVVDPDLGGAAVYGYRDPYRHADVRVTYGPPPPRKPRKRRRSK